MLERRIRGAILHTLHNTGEISAGYLKALLIYEGIVFESVRELIRILQWLADRGYVKFDRPFSALQGDIRVDITPKGRALVEGQIPDKDVEV